jgi:addiction module HigA family antidote
MPMQDPAHPGPIILHECIEPLGLTIPEAAASLGVPASELSDLVAGRAGLSPEMAIRVGKVFGSSPGSWYRMQAAYDMAQAEKRSGDIPVPSQLWPSPAQAAQLASYRLAEPAAQSPIYQYDPDTATVSIPASEVLHLGRGFLGALRIMQQQIGAFTEYVPPTAIASSDYSPRIASVTIRLNRLIQQFSDTTLPTPYAYDNEDVEFNSLITVADFITMKTGVREIAEVVNQLFDRLERYQAPSLTTGFSFSDLDDLARAEYIVEAWDEFASTHPDILPFPDLMPKRNNPNDFGALFQEIEAFLRDNQFLNSWSPWPFDPSTGADNAPA